MKWLQWMLDNAWTVVIVGGVLLQLVQAMMRKKGGADSAPAEEQAKEYEFEDPELAERTRKIREEIQRKIDQRTRGQVDPKTMEVEPEAPPPLIREVVGNRTPAHGTSSRLEIQRQAEILEEQAALMERLREAEGLKRSAQKRIAFEATTADHSGAARVATRSTVLDDLRDPAALRRAFILREVLGPPVALRK
jgi:hypothetical protein